MKKITIVASALVIGACVWLGVAAGADPIVLRLRLGQSVDGAGLGWLCALARGDVQGRPHFVCTSKAGKQHLYLEMSNDALTVKRCLSTYCDRSRVLLTARP